MLRCPQGKYRGTFSFLEVIKALGRFSGGRGGTFVLAGSSQGSADARGLAWFGAIPPAKQRAAGPGEPTFILS